MPKLTDVLHSGQTMVTVLIGKRNVLGFDANTLFASDRELAVK
jgi:hypothetical protein